MITVKAKYKGDLNCNAMHMRSNTIISTDAPIDNEGKGASFSPTDLVATAIGTCILTIMGIKAKDIGVSVKGAIIDVKKIMGNNPRRISAMEITIHMPKRKYNAQAKTILEKVARTCPVAKSLHPDIVLTIHTIWQKQ